MPRHYVITITSDHPDADRLARDAALMIATGIDWGDDHSAEVALLAAADPDVVDTPRCHYVAGWDMEPGEPTR